MKKLFMLIMLLLFSSALAFSQVQDSTHGRKGLTKEQKKELKKENHGKDVSRTAHETPSGKGKGAVVSGVARQKGVMQRAKPVPHMKPVKPPVRPGKK